MAPAHRPLAGMRVLEAGPLLPVPSAGANLQRLGAEVMRLEGPNPNPAKVIYGGWLHELYGADKTEVVLDLSTAADRTRLGELLDEIDVVIAGYRPASVVAFGLDARTVLERYPTIVHCAIVGHRSDSPAADRPGHDLSFLAGSGTLGVPAGPSAIGIGPVRPAVPVADLAAGAVATQAILAGLLTRASTGQGCMLEVAISDVMRAWAAPRLGPAVSVEYGAALDPANDIYAARDGAHLTVAAIEPKFWTALCREMRHVVNLPVGAEHFGSADRVGHMNELSETLAAGFRRRDRATWIETLGAAGVPVDPVITPDEVVAEIGTDPRTWRHLATPLPIPTLLEPGTAR